MKINILDQSPVISGSSPSVSLENSIDLAKLGDELGYHRYWIAEHHSTGSFASASPEIFIPRAASITNHIRIGSGGVLISHYSPFKIAEQFNMLSSLFPGRIDLGIGRAPGGDSAVMKVLRTSGEDAFLKTDELINYMSASSNNKLLNGVIASPAGVDLPEMWILGTSPDSAMYAAKNGLRYAVGAFINDEYMLRCFESYYQNFQPSIFLKEPYLNLALFVICGETEQDAQRMAKCSEYWLVHTFLKGANKPFPDETTALNYTFSIEEKMLIEYRRKSAVIGSRKTVADNLKQLITKFAIHELTIVTITSNHDERKNSYKMIAEELLG